MFRWLEKNNNAMFITTIHTFSIPSHYFFSLYDGLFLQNLRPKLNEISRIRKMRLKLKLEELLLFVVGVKVEMPPPPLYI